MQNCVLSSRHLIAERGESINWHSESGEWVSLADFCGPLFPKTHDHFCTLLALVLLLCAGVCVVGRSRERLAPTSHLSLCFLELSDQGPMSADAVRVCGKPRGKRPLSETFLNIDNKGKTETKYARRPLGNSSPVVRSRRRVIFS